MSEQTLGREIPHQTRVEHVSLDEQPLLFQQLARASHMFGLIGEFYTLLEAKTDFSVAYGRMCAYIEDVSGLGRAEVEKILKEDFDIALFEDDLVEPARPQW